MRFLEDCLSVGLGILLGGLLLWGWMLGPWEILDAVASLVR